MRRSKEHSKKKSIFRAIFVPLILVMVLQGAIFYVAAVYGGMVDSLNKNAVDILSERLTNRKNEIETQFNNRWTEMDVCEDGISRIYREYESKYGGKPLLQDDKSVQVDFLGDSADVLIEMLRQNQVNGVFLILNDSANKTAFYGQEEKYGLCIRDINQNSVYTDREDLLIERAPSSIISKTRCSLDSWWEAKYTFGSVESGAYYYLPLNAAWENAGSDSDDLAYFCGGHSLSTSDHEVVSYSIPLIDDNGYPYGVLGIELTTSYLATQLPSRELSNSSGSCYILATKSEDSDECIPITANGALYNRCFSSGDTLSVEKTDKLGGYSMIGRTGAKLYGVYSQIEIYNNNNPHEDEQLVIAALTDREELFYYGKHVKLLVFVVSMLTLVIGVISIYVVSRRFAAPITNIAKRARDVDPHSDFDLEHLDIVEIDQLVDSIETLSRNVSKETARTEFFSRMSHDMRTPMNAIISFSSEELLEGISERQKDDYLSKIHSSGEYLLGLINEVLDMTKIESNKVDLHCEAVRADALWKTIIPIVDELASKRHLRFEKDIAIEPNMYVMADSQHISQIVMNLLSNAVKFTPEGGTVSLKIRMEESDIAKAPIRCCFSVKDTGIGMSRDFLQKLYTPFEQENRGREGTGLGLSICKKLVGMMGGTINCVSRKNEGTTFYVEIPLERAAADADIKSPVEEIEAPKIDDAVLQGKRILLCEDHPLNMQIAVKLLEKKGIIVDTAGDGRQGVDKFAASEIGEYDAILMDIRMPVLDGLEATKMIRALTRPDAATVAIIAMTANAFEEDIRKSRSAGMNAHLSKPIEPKKLYQTLSELIKDKN